ncbi:hypothetical protein MASR1M36_11170 [Candidatus Cloacimonadaceae bacterium]
MSEQQNQTRCFIQAKLSDFSNRISQGYHKPVRGFFKDMLMGIYWNSTSLHNIAKFIQDDTSTKRPVNVYTVTYEEITWQKILEHSD